MEKFDNNILDAPEIDGINLQYAGFWWRFLAALIDGIILYLAGFILAKLTGTTNYKTIINSFNEDIQVYTEVAYSSGMSMILNWIYFAGLESSAQQASIGKRVLGIKVTDMHGQPISFARASGRFFAKYISLFTLLIGYIIAGFTPKKQALHDIIANTLVLKKPEGTY